MLEHMKIWKTVLIACLWLFCGILAAEFITPAQALNISGKWIRHFQPKVSTSLKQMQMYLNGEFFFISEQRVFLGNDDLPELYLVSFIDDTFAILPADDNLPPILAYATKPLMVGSTLPSACYAIMEAYASNVRHCRITSTTNPVYQRQWQQLAAADFIDTVKVRFSEHDAQITHPITVNISTDPILPIWNVDSYSLSIFYQHEGLQFASAEIGETISESGNLVVNSSEPGLLQLSWTGDNPLLGGGALLKLIFVGIETGSYLITPVAMDYAGLCVENLGEVWVSIHSTIESPAESSLRLSNALRVNYGETATLNLFTSYLPPSWDITHYEFNIDFPPDKISFSEVQTSETLSAGAPDISTELYAPGLLHVSVDSDNPITGLSELLLKICFITIGNTSSISVAQVHLTNFFYNGFAVPGTINAIVTLAPVSAVSEEFPGTQLMICAHPNPFKTGTMINLSQKEQAPMILDIYNLKGQKVYSLHKGNLPEGNHRFTWQGRDQAGNVLSSGIYFLRAKSMNNMQIIKITLIK